MTQNDTTLNLYIGKAAGVFFTDWVARGTK